MCSKLARQERTMLNMSWGPPRKVCPVGGLEPTVEAQGRWLPNFFQGKLGIKLGTKVGQAAKVGQNYNNNVGQPQG